MKPYFNINFSNTIRADTAITFISQTTLQPYTTRLMYQFFFKLTSERTPFINFFLSILTTTPTSLSYFTSYTRTNSFNFLNKLVNLNAVHGKSLFVKKSLFYILYKNNFLNSSTLFLNLHFLNNFSNLLNKIENLDPFHNTIFLLKQSFLLNESLFTFKINKFDKKVLKYKKDKKKYFLVWQFLPKFKRLNYTMYRFMQHVKFVPLKKFFLRFEFAFMQLFTNPTKMLFNTLQVRSHQFVFKNYKNSLMRNFTKLQ